MKKLQLRNKIREIIREMIDANDYASATLTTQGPGRSRFTKTGRPPGVMEDDTDPTLKQLKASSKDSIAVIAGKLQDIKKAMKTTVNKWKTAEGKEKEQLKNKLGEYTKIKKDLESKL